MARFWLVHVPLGLAYVSVVFLAGLERPRLELRAFPQMSMAGGKGYSEILFTAEIKGPEDPAWYCPAIVWTRPDGTVAEQESDCPPWEEREEFPRRWTRRERWPPHPESREWVMEVRLERNGKPFARETINVYIR